jgi:hypothetical protein
MSNGKKLCCKVYRLFDEKIVMCEHHILKKSESKAIPLVEAADEETAIRYTGAVKNIRELEELGLKDISSESLAYGKIKDSGARREFGTGAVRDIQEGKGRCDLLPLDVICDYLLTVKIPECQAHMVLEPIYEFITDSDIRHLEDSLESFVASHDWHNHFTMFLEVSKHFEEGAKKYGENNWQKGIPVHCYIDSAVRHYLKWLRGDTDEPHDRAFVWNLMCCIWEVDYHVKELEND